MHNSTHLLKVISQAYRKRPLASILVVFAVAALASTLTAYIINHRHGVNADVSPVKPSSSLIKTAGLVYNDPPVDKLNWLKLNEDIGVFNSYSSGTVTGKAKTSLIYESFTDVDINQPGYQDILSFAGAKSESVEKSMMHYSKDVRIPVSGPDPISGTRKNTILESHFDKVLTKGQGPTEAIQDITRSIEDNGSASPKSIDYPIILSIKICTNRQYVYVGSSSKFDQINFNILTGAQNTLALSYSSTNNNGWTDARFQDNTQGFQVSGQIKIDPSTSWAATSLGGYYLYWMRISCNKAITIKTDVFKNAKYVWDGVPAISGKPYTSDGENQIIPGWDAHNDKDGDGFVSDAEFRKLVNNEATARSLREARVPSYYYRGRFVANVLGASYIEGIKQKLITDITQRGSSGVFIDNTNVVLPDTFKGTSNYVEIQKQPYVSMVRSFINQLKAGLGTSRLLYTNFGIAGAEDTGLQVDGGMIEGGIGINVMDIPTWIARFGRALDAAAGQKKNIIVNSNPDQSYLTAKNVTKERANIYALARYYLTANSFTFFDYQARNMNAKPWEDWFSAIKFDIGVPKGNLQVQTYQSPQPDVSLRNLITNPDLSPNAATGVPQDWTCSSIKGNVGCSSVIEQGEPVLKLTGDYDTSGNTGYGGVYQTLSLEPNTTYTISGQVRSSGLTTASSSAIRFAATCRPQCYHYGWDGSNSNGWQTVYSIIHTPSLSDNSTAATVSDDVWAMLSEANGTAYFRNLKLVKGEYPYSFLYTREFTNATVYLRPELGQLSTGNGDDTAKTFALNQSYKGFLKSDGTLVNYKPSSGANSSLILKSLEATILVK